MSKLKVIFAISQMNGGGAENVMTQLANYIGSLGHEVRMLVTNRGRTECRFEGLSKDIPIDFLKDNVESAKKTGIYGMAARLACRLLDGTGKIPDKAAEISFMSVYGGYVSAAKEYLKDKTDWKIVVFLQPANQILMKACENTPNKLIISERADPNIYFRSRYAGYFLRNYYPNVSGAVFQTKEAMDMYSVIRTDNKQVILNPLPRSLPEPYHGKRKKRIVNFCRLAKQKNLPLLIDAFNIFAEDHPRFLLEIIGDGELKDEIIGYAGKAKFADRIKILPHRKELHEEIEDYSMFVSSSDYEGLSNSMLEAMAIGLPVICTDCPIGGARMVIRDHINGLLIPMNSPERLADAMGEIADNAEFAEKMAKNAANIREMCDIESVGDSWIRIIENAE